MDGEKTANEVATTPAVMEFRLINPTEDGFLREIKWNKDELEAGVRKVIADYENVVYTEDNMNQAKADRAKLNKLMKEIEERRKMVKKTINAPYEVFESELKSILALIQEPVSLIDQQVKSFEDKQKEEKRESILSVYTENIGDLAEVLPFESIFDSRYLNKTYKLTTAQSEIREKIEKVRTDLETIDSMDSKYKLQAKDVYIKTLDLSKALAENKRLSDLEEKLEAEKRRREEEEAERKRKEEEAQRQMEEQERIRKEMESNIPEPDAKEPEPAAEQANDVAVQEENVPNEPESVPKEEIGTQKEAQAHQPEKKFKTRFSAVGTREQLQRLVQFMDENNIEYGRI